MDVPLVAHISELVRGLGRTTSLEAGSGSGSGNGEDLADKKQSEHGETNETVMRESSIVFYIKLVNLFVPGSPSTSTSSPKQHGFEIEIETEKAKAEAKAEASYPKETEANT